MDVLGLGALNLVVLQQCSVVVVGNDSTNV
jgi:hypothetical protein